MQVKKKILAATVLASLLSICTTQVSLAENASKGEMSKIPPSPATEIVPQLKAEDFADESYAQELVTDNIEFSARGYMDFDWQTHTSYVTQVLDEVVLPDYIKRTGKTRPDNPSIDVAAAMITNPYFNDLIVQSRLPGDCKPNGCLVQIYSLVGELWVKKFQATAFAIMAKPGDKLGTVLIGLVGNEDYPSKTVVWTGSVFKDQ